MRDENSTPDLNDQLRRLRAGEAGALDLLCTTLQPIIASHVRRQAFASTLRWIQVEDLVQWILQEVVRALDHLPPSADADELLRRVHHTTGLRVMDAARNHGKLVGSSAGPSPDHVPADGARTTGPVTAEDRRRQLEEILAQMSEKYASVVRLCGLEGLSHVKAGERLGLSADTVRKRFEKARDALAKRLGSGL